MQIQEANVCTLAKQCRLYLVKPKKELCAQGQQDHESLITKVSIGAFHANVNHSGIFQN